MQELRDKIQERDVQVLMQTRHLQLSPRQGGRQLKWKLLEFKAGGNEALPSRSPLWPHPSSLRREDALRSRMQTPVACRRGATKVVCRLDEGPGGVVAAGIRF